MGEYLREARRRRGGSSGPPGRLARAGVSGLVVVLLALGLLLLVPALVRLIPLGIGGAAVVIGAGLLWWRSNRHELAADRGGRAQIRLAFASLVALLVGLGTWAIGMIKGW